MHASDDPPKPGIDPSLVPKRALASGAEMPAIGLGTFGSDSVTHETVAEAVRQALILGYRHIDCASVYGNEAQIGEVLSASSVGRDELWLSSKVWNDRHDDVGGACEQTLRDLGVEVLDNYLVHWPFPNFHPPQCDVDERNPDAVPFSAERFLHTWGQMEALVERGLVRHIGTSNMTMAKLDSVLPGMNVRPSVNQMELHPHFQQPELRSYLAAENIAAIGFCPIGSPERPERDRTPDDTSPTDDPVVRQVALAHDVHPATLCVAWAVNAGHTPIPFSTNPRNMQANLAAASVRLTDTEMNQLAQVERACRLIKGQVFLWRDGQSWRDLWDEDGAIAV